MNTWRGVVGVAAWSALSLLGAASARAQTVEPTAYLGTESIAFAEVRRPAELVDRLTSDRLLTLLTGLPGYSEALESDGTRQLLAAVDSIAESLDTDPVDGLRKLLGGGIVASIEESAPPRLVVVATPTDAGLLERTHARLVELAREEARKKAGKDPIREFAHRGVDCFSVSEQEAHAIVDGRLVLASGEAALKAALDRARSGDPCVSQTAAFKERAAAVEPTANAWAYVRLDRLKALDPKRFGGDEPADPGAAFLFGPWVEALRQAPWLAASITWDDDRLAASISLPTPESGHGDVYAGYFPPADAGAPAPPELPGSIASVNLWRDLNGVWEHREEILPPEALQGLAQLDGLAGTFFGARDFGSGVLEPLGPSWQIVVAAQDYAAMEPSPAVKLPAFALIVELSPDHPEFARRLRVAYQSFIGLANLGGAQSGAPPLNLGSRSVEGVEISTAVFMTNEPPPGAEPAAAEQDGEVHLRHNFTPAVAEVDGRFILSSSIGLAEQLVRALKAEPSAEPADATLLMRVDGPALAALGDLNRERLILQNMLEDGNDRPTAERNVGGLLSLLRYLGAGELKLHDGEETSRLSLEFTLGTP